MEQNIYAFRVTPMGEEYLPQISYALEKRTELLSRNQYPGMWKATDKLNAIPQKEKSQRRNRLKSVLFLVLGVFCFVGGVMDPKELTGPLIIGAAAILWGGFGLFRGKIKRKNPFDKSARLLLEQRKTTEDAKVVFDEVCMVIMAGGEEELIPYDRMEYIVEAEGLLLITFAGKVIAVKKDDMICGDMEGFRAFITKQTTFVPYN